MKHAIAKAYPIQGLIKYHGLRDKELRLPYHDSISVCTAPFCTDTFAEFDTLYKEDCFIVNGKMLEGRAKERLSKIVNVIRERSGITEHAYIESKNNFPSNIGLGASASGFAAAALALAEASGIKYTTADIVQIARLGAASAARAVVGGISLLRKDGTAEQLAAPEDLEMSIIVVPIEGFKFTDDAHKDAETSPYFNARIRYVRKAISEMKKAVDSKDVDMIGRLAEKDTRGLHAITMTGDAGKIYWKPDTLKVIAKVKELQDRGIPAFYSIDTGASVYVNTPAEFEKTVYDELRAMNLEKLVSDPGITICKIGGPALIVNYPDRKDVIR
jgi:phosphomevalonate decarboxylase